MRHWAFGLIFALGTVTAASAQAPSTAGAAPGTTAGATPGAGRPAGAVRQPTPARTSVAPATRAAEKPDYERARREAEARQKRWDERIKRVTGGMCVGC